MAWNWPRRWRLPFAPDRADPGVGEMLAMLERAAASGFAPDDRVQDPAAMVERLEALAGEYRQCPFVHGQLVTRRPNTGGHGAGAPHVVLEVLPEGGEILFLYEEATVTPSNDPDYGARYDMRVLHESPDGQMHAHWVESYLYEPWSAPADEHDAGSALEIALQYRPEQFEGPWADMPNSVTASFAGPGEVSAYSVVSGWDLGSGKDMTTIHVPGRGPMILGEPGPSGLINKFEPGRPIEMRPGFGLVVDTPEGEPQRIATSGPCLVAWSGAGGTPGEPIFWDEDLKAFNAEGHGIEIVGWEWVGFANDTGTLAEVRIRP